MELWEKILIAIIVGVISFPLVTVAIAMALDYYYLNLEDSVIEFLENIRKKVFTISW